MKNLLQHRPVKWLLGAVLMALGSLIINSGPVAAQAALDPTCYDIEFIWVRESGAPLRATHYWEYRVRITEQLAGSSLSYRFYEVGEEMVGGFRYPAVTIGHPTTLLGAFTGSGEMFAYGQSVAQGVGELNRFIRERAHLCPGTGFVLGGFSQGAQVAGEVMSTMPDWLDERLVFAMLFGDPKLNLPEGRGVLPLACRGEGLASFRAHVPVCRTSEGILGGRNPYLQPSQYSRTAVYCEREDMICGSTKNVTSFDGHRRYVEHGHVRDGAVRAVERVTRRYPAAFSGLAIANRNELLEREDLASQDVVVLIDTTGSMEDELYPAVLEASWVAQQILQAGGRVALVEYRDADDEWDDGRRAARLLCDFSCSIEEFMMLAQGLEAPLAAGGDEPEGLLYALKIAYDDLTWRPFAQKSVIVFTDASFHSPDRRDWNLDLDWAVQRSRELNPVQVYVTRTRELQPGEVILDEWMLQHLTRMTGGSYEACYELCRSFMDNVMLRPVAKLKLVEQSGVIGEEFWFDASLSYGLGGRTITRVDWDFQGAGMYTRSGEELMVGHVFKHEFKGWVIARVWDDMGQSNIAAVRVEVLQGVPAEEIDILPNWRTGIRRDIFGERLIVALDQQVPFSPPGAEGTGPVLLQVWVNGEWVLQEEFWEFWGTQYWGEMPCGPTVVELRVVYANGWVESAGTRDTEALMECVVGDDDGDDSDGDDEGDGDEGDGGSDDGDDGGGDDEVGYGDDENGGSGDGEDESSEELYYDGAERNDYHPQEDAGEVENATGLVSRGGREEAPQDALDGLALSEHDEPESGRSPESGYELPATGRPMDEEVSRRGWRGLWWIMLLPLILALIARHVILRDKDKR
ncbi:cutinase family protein [Candidatus Saccharibacteria bacterium]|nr:cutinase family protein [Candidatus Saccharibacteria bacterium]